MSQLNVWGNFQQQQQALSIGVYAESYVRRGAERTDDFEGLLLWQRQQYWRRWDGGTGRDKWWGKERYCGDHSWSDEKGWSAGANGIAGNNCSVEYTGVLEPTGVLAAFPIIDVRKIRQIKYVAPELFNDESSGHTEQQERRRGKRGLHRLNWSSSRRQRRWGDKKSIHQAAAYLYVGAQSRQDRPSPPTGPWWFSDSVDVESEGPMRWILWRAQIQNEALGFKADRLLYPHSVPTGLFISTRIRSVADSASSCSHHAQDCPCWAVWKL